MIVAFHVGHADGFRSEWSLPTRTLVVTGEPDAVPGRLLYADGHHVVLNEPIDPVAITPDARLRIPGPFDAGTGIAVTWTGFGAGGAVRATTWRGTAATFTPGADIPVPAATIAWSAGRFVQFSHTAATPDGRVHASPGIALTVSATDA